MSISEIAVLIFSVLALVPTITSLTRFDQWWVRGFDFPRLQISVLTLFLLGLVILVFPMGGTWQVTLATLLSLSFLYQAIKIYPYTILARKQVFRLEGRKSNTRISILVSNVLTPNEKYDKLLKLVNYWNPDILLTLETDKVWEEKLEVLEKEYPYTVKIPQDNLYGMHLFSKLELEDIEVKYLISEEIPSIHGYVLLRNGERVNIHCLHPKPPSPTEDDTSTKRDAELLLIGKEVKEQDSTLVFGDLNDVAWSRTTRLFQQISGLVDPRIGRGFYNTYHAGIPVFRWPLDHVFHSKDFALLKLKRLPNIGSDHFPIYIELNHVSIAEKLNDKPERADKEEEEWAEEKIEKGR
jgi:endonuclease/exonuclease/phosphatase (EEP) superfamily protein YafD